MTYHLFSLPQRLHHDFVSLVERGLMTPSYLSSLVMMLILPATLLVTKQKSLKNTTTGCDVQSWFERTTWNAPQLMVSRYAYWLRAYIEDINYTHACTVLTVDGLETLEAACRETTSNQYEVFCCGNSQDAMCLWTARHRIRMDESKNYVFWNYPGVGLSQGKVYSVDDLYRAAYKQVRRLLVDKNIPPEDITLRGFSLGGGVAAHVAKQLLDDGYPVHLEIDRSFSTLATAASHLFEVHEAKWYRPLVRSTISFALIGASLGNMFASLIASVGVCVAMGFASVGMLIAYAHVATGYLIKEQYVLTGELLSDLLSYLNPDLSLRIKNNIIRVDQHITSMFYARSLRINALFSAISLFLERLINGAGSLLGGSIALGGGVLSAVMGFGFGLLFLPFQCVLTNTFMTIQYALSIFLTSVQGQMDSVQNIHDVLARSQSGSVTVLNSMEDEVIGVDASLNLGLGFKPPTQDAANEEHLLKHKMTSFWYSRGKHSEYLDPAYLMPVDDSVAFS